MRERNLLESGVPVSLLNNEARTEKKAVSPHVMLHYYFTRKPLITARLAVAGSLLTPDDVKSKEDFYQLMNLHTDLKTRAYKQVPERLLQLIEKKHPKGVTLLDPFAGTGTIPLEALRLGLDVVALDYNPVSHLVMKGTLEYPKKYGGIIESGRDKLLSDVKKHAEEIVTTLKEELSILFPTHNGQNARCYIYAWAVECPVCGGVTPLVHSWRLDVKNELYLQPVSDEKSLHFKIMKGSKPPRGNIKRGKATCILCTKPIPREHIVKDIQDHEREMLLAIYLENREFELPNETDYEALEEAKKQLKRDMSELGQFVPSESIPEDRRSLPAGKYLKYWYRLFTPRQLLIHASYVREVRRIIEPIAKRDSDYAAAIGTYLSMILSKHLMHNSRCSRWNPTGMKAQDPFATRGISMMWVHAEVNPFVKTAGSLVNGIVNILTGLEYLIQNLMPSQTQLVENNHRPASMEIVKGSIMSWRPSRKFSLIVTDPPYYDDVPYPELLQFFQVWHSRTVGDLLDIPPIPSTTEELSVGRDRNNEIFESRMTIAIKKLHQLLEDDGTLVLFYAHKSIDGWKYVLESLRQTGFIVTSTHTLRTESGTDLISHGKASVFHSLLITARKRLEDKSISITDLEKEIREKMDARYDELTNIYGADRLNLMVAASGIVIEAITSYAEIESFTRNTAEYALETGQQYLIELFAKKSLNIDYVDPKTMLYVWLRYSPAKDIPFSDFNQILKALGLEEVLVSDLIQKDKSNVRLLDYSERGTLEVNGSDPVVAVSVIDAVHLVLRGYMRGGISEATPMIRESPYGEETLLHTLEGLAKLASLRPGYSEGEYCIKFLKDWGVLYDREVTYKVEKLDKYPTEEEE